MHHRTTRRYLGGLACISLLGFIASTAVIQVLRFVHAPPALGPGNLDTNPWELMTLPYYAYLLCFGIGFMMSVVHGVRIMCTGKPARILAGISLAGFVGAFAAMRAGGSEMPISREGDATFAVLAGMLLAVLALVQVLDLALKPHERVPYDE